jgi:anaerobic selenocysteine-containing dehydrogenase
VAESVPAFAGLTESSLGPFGQEIHMPAAPVPAGAVARREPEGDGLLLVTTTEIFGDALAWESDALEAVRTAARVALAPGQAAAAGVSAGSRARLTSPYGSCELEVTIREELPEGAAFVATGPPPAGVGALLPADHGPVRVTVEAVGT